MCKVSDFYDNFQIFRNFHQVSEYIYVWRGLRGFPYFVSQGSEPFKNPINQLGGHVATYLGKKIMKIG